MMYDRDTLDATVSAAFPKVEVRALTACANFVGWVLERVAVVALLNCDYAACKPRVVECIQ